MLSPIPGAYGSEPSLVRGDASLREKDVNANRKRINTPQRAQTKALTSKAPINKASIGMKNFSAFLCPDESYRGRSVNRQFAASYA